MQPLVINRSTAVFARRLTILQPRIRKSAVRDQNKCDEHSADPAIAVEERVNRLELSVRESCLQQSEDAVVMQEHLAPTLERLRASLASEGVEAIIERVAG